MSNVTRIRHNGVLRSHLSKLYSNSDLRFWGETMDRARVQGDTKTDLTRFARETK